MLRVVPVIALVTATAHAEPSDREREIHLAAVAAGGAIYLGVELIAKPHLAPEQCRICDPPRIDAAVSDALIWDDPHAANVASTVIGYAGTQLYALGLLVASQGDHRRWADDTLPVLESGVAIGLLHHLVKFTVGRRRPFVLHAPPGRPYDDDDNASLFSGHTGLAFAVATSAGIVAHERGYRVEPYIWAGGYALAAATGYLRIAADKHWFTDVVIGALVGVAVGCVVPLTIHRDNLVDSGTPAAPRMISIGAAF